MEKVLSQEEVDSLLDGIGEGKIETETDIPEPGDALRPYDFSRQNGTLQSRMPAIGMIEERLATFLRASLGGTTGSDVDVRVASSESAKFGEFCRSLPLPSSLNIFKMSPLRGFALLVLEGPLIFSFVDAFFGGKGVSAVKLEGRSFTNIENRIIDKIVRIVLRDLEKAWSDIHAVETTLIRTEMDTRFATIVTPSDQVIVSRFNIDLERASGLMTLCIPFSTVEAVRDKLKHRYQGEKMGADPRWRTHVMERVQALRVRLSCTLGQTRMTGRDLLQLKLGDVIALNQSVNEPVIVRVEDIPKFHGYPGTYNNKQAIKIKALFAKE